MLALAGRLVLVLVANGGQSQVRWCRPCLPCPYLLPPIHLAGAGMMV